MPETKLHKVQLSPSTVEHILRRRGGKLHAYDSINPEKSALIVIDMQNVWLQEGMAAYSPYCAGAVPATCRCAQCTSSSPASCSRVRWGSRGKGRRGRRRRTMTTSRSWRRSASAAAGAGLRAASRERAFMSKGEEKVIFNIPTPARPPVLRVSALPCFSGISFPDRTYYSPVKQRFMITINFNKT